MPSLDPDVLTLDNPEWLLQQLGLKPSSQIVNERKVIIWFFVFMAAIIAGFSLLLTVSRNLVFLLLAILACFADFILFMKKGLKSGNLPANPSYRLGTSQLDAGNYNAAIGHFKLAITLVPSYLPARKGLILAYQRAGNVEMAMKILEDLLKSNPANHDLLLMLDALLEDINDSERAIGTWNAHLESATALDKATPATVRVHARMQEARAFMMNQVAAWLEKQQKTSEAERMLEQSIRLFPGENGAWLQLAQLLIKRHEYANAAKLLQEAFDAVPDFDMALVFLAECHFKMGEVDKARDVLTKVTARNPRDVAVMINMGYVYGEAGLNVEALSTVLSAKTLEPRNPAAWVNHGAILLDLGRYDEAIEVSTKAMAYGNSNYRAISLAVIGGALYQKNQIDEARAAYDRALQFDGKNVAVHFGILQVLLRKSNIDGARAKIVDIQALKPKSQFFPYAMALCLVAEGKRDEAIQYLQQAVNRRPLLKTDLIKEPLLDPIKSDPRFLALIAR